LCLGTLGFERLGKRKKHLEVRLVVANFEKEDSEKKKGRKEIPARLSNFYFDI